MDNLKSYSSSESDREDDKIINCDKLQDKNLFFETSTILLDKFINKEDNIQESQSSGFFNLSEYNTMVLDDAGSIQKTNNFNNKSLNLKSDNIDTSFWLNQSICDGIIENNSMSKDKKVHFNCNNKLVKVEEKSEFLNVKKYQSKKYKKQISISEKLPECYSINPTLKYNKNVHLKVNKFHKNSLPSKLKLLSLEHKGPINRIKWSISHSNLLVTASMDSTIKLWDINGLASIATFDIHSSGVKDLTWYDYEPLIFSCSLDCSIKLTDIEKKIVLNTLTHSKYLTCIKNFDKNICVVGTNNMLLAWDVRTPNGTCKEFIYKDKFGQVLDLCFISEQEFVTSNDLVSRDASDRTIMTWDFRSTAVISNQIFHEKYTCPRLCCHPFKSEFIAQTHGNYIAQFKSTTPFRMNKFIRYEGHKTEGYSIGCDISNDGNIILSGSADGSLYFYDYKDAKIISNIQVAENEIILDCMWHPLTRNMIAFTTWDNKLYVYS